MRILITGGSGPIGIALAQQLIAAGHEVVNYDVREPALDHGAEFIAGDVRDFDRLAVAALGCDSGLHLAVLAGGAAASEIMSVNVLGAYGFLQAARAARFRCSVIASSAPVHLAPGVSDNTTPLASSDGADHTYDLTKSLQENMSRDFHSHGLPVLGLRFGHIVLGDLAMNLEQTVHLRDENYCRGGWVALEDVVAACAAALAMTPSRENFELLNIVGAIQGRGRFQVARAERRLGFQLQYDFSEYP